MLRKQIRPAIVATLILMVLTGLVYPGIVTAISQVLFPYQASGSLIEQNGKIVGSELLAQGFTEDQYFHPRPSAAGSGYDATSSGGSNKGPTDANLADTIIAGRVNSVIEKNGGGDWGGGAVRGSIPSDMVTASGSGLDPHISPANAELQIPRVARARGTGVEAIRTLVSQHTEQRQFGILGESRVNVLMLNVALDREFPVTNKR